MGESGKRPALTQEGHGFLGRHLCPLYVGRAVAADIQVEGLLKGRYASLFDQGLGHVRASYGRAGGDLLYPLPGYVHSQPAELLHDAASAVKSRAAQAGKLLPQLLVVGVVAEHAPRPGDVGAHLNTGDEREA
jgi:hypothetical protein